MSASPDSDLTVAVAMGDLDGEGGVDLVAANAGEPARVYRAETVDGMSGYRFGKDVGVDTQVTTAVGEVEPIDLSNSLALFVTAESTSEIEVGLGAYLLASGDITIDATTTSAVDLTTLTPFFGLTYGSTKPTAQVIVRSGAEMWADGNLNLTAQSNNDLSVITFVPAVGEKYNIAASLATSEVTSNVDLEMGAVVDVENATILAENLNSFSNSAIASGFGTTSDADAGFGVTLVLSYNDSIATADVSGTIRTRNDLVIDARAINSLNVSRSYASFNAGSSVDRATDDTKIFILDLVLDFLEANADFPTANIGDLSEVVVDFQSSEPEDGYAAGIAVATSDNKANAYIGSGAIVTVEGDASVESLAQDTFQISATGNVGGLAPPEDTSVGGAIAYSKVANQANSHVTWDAVVDVRNSLDIFALAEALAPINTLDLILALLGFGEATQADAIGGIHGYGTAFTSTDDTAMTKSIRQAIDEPIADLAGRTLEENEVGTSFIHAGAAVGDGGLAFGGGVNLMFTHNVSNAGIAGGARINQRSEELWSPVQTTGQDVDVDAVAISAQVHYAGNSSVLNLVNNEGETGIGGFFELLFTENRANAYIADTAIVSARRNVEVDAKTDNKITTVVFAGSKAEKLAIDGAIAYVRIKNETVANIEDRAFVDAGSDVSVNAMSDVNAVTVTPGISISEEKAVGIGAAFTDVRDKTQAFIGDSFEATPAGGYTGGVYGQVSAGGNVNVNAISNPQLWTFGAAATVAAGGTDNGGGGSGNTVDLDNGGDGGAGDGSSFGFGLSAAVAFNFLDQRAEAFIRDAVTVTGGNEVRVEADSNPLLVSAAGGFAFADDQVAIGGTYAHNQFDQVTRAFVENATINGGDLTVDAHTDNTVLGIAASGAGSKDDGAIAGGVNLNLFDQNTQAYIGDHAEITVDDMTVTAENETLIIPIAGAIAISAGGSFGIGANAALLFSDSQTKAWIADEANVMNTGDARVFAENDVEVVSVSASVGIATDGFGAAGGGFVDESGPSCRGVHRSRGLGSNRRQPLYRCSRQHKCVGGGWIRWRWNISWSWLSVANSNLDRTVKAYIGEGANVTAKESAVASSIQVEADLAVLE